MDEIGDASGLLAKNVERMLLLRVWPVQPWIGELCRRALNELGLIGITSGPDRESTFNSEELSEWTNQIADVCERLIRMRVSNLPLSQVEESGTDSLPEILWTFDREALRETLVEWRAQLGAELERDQQSESETSDHQGVDTQSDVIEVDSSEPSEVASLNQMLRGARLYKTSSDYKDLLDFIVRLRNFAPFNAMLLHIQKPGMRFAATVKDWRVRFGRRPMDDARPLLIMKPFGPVDLVYDVQDTCGRPLPEDVSAFIAYGTADEERLQSASRALEKRKIHVRSIDAGDGNAGSIRKIDPSDTMSAKYLVYLNRNHTVAVRLATLAHEIAHLLLGHLGPDEEMKISHRTRPPHAIREIEAESVSYLVCERVGIKLKSQPYLSSFISEEALTADLDIPRIIGVAADVERWLGLHRP